MSEKIANYIGQRDRAKIPKKYRGQTSGNWRSAFAPWSCLIKNVIARRKSQRSLWKRRRLPGRVRGDIGKADLRRKEGRVVRENGGPVRTS